MTFLGIFVFIATIFITLSRSNAIIIPIKNGQKYTPRYISPNTIAQTIKNPVIFNAVFFKSTIISPRSYYIYILNTCQLI